MAAAAHDPEFAQRVGVPGKVAKDFNRADTGGPMLHAKRPSATPEPGPSDSDADDSAAAATKASPTDAKRVASMLRADARK